MKLQQVKGRKPKTADEKDARSRKWMADGASIRDYFDEKYWPNNTDMAQLKNNRSLANAKHNKAARQRKKMRQVKDVIKRSR